ncbi:triphosphoribosyl-dephospho-CoA synthase [Paraburkholderia aromaticivorans]|uniref:triphosphoribosyl-dephospho-CoA synthase n=1 Tax=Paraburkholderia aromaticivorans TaxID=2026199 RepID=UPI001455FC87|nr:triphosphoribosyl-dephospho-CoA synthase [Paraburkholderia aromaticivorans]
MNAQAATAATAAIEAAFLWACELDVACAKPGNVSVASPGHRMTADLFVASARAACGPLAQRGAPVGARIEAAISRTHEAAGCNTNLGIVLLCAPLAAAFETQPASPAALGLALQRVLAALSVDDASAAYRAIALANPAGLGKVPSQNVGAPPTIDLRAAMRLAADRDSIARQYAVDFADVLGFGLARFHATLAARRGSPSALSDAVLATWLAFLTRWPDSHIARKHGLAWAEWVMREAVGWLTQATQGPLDPHALEAWDNALKSDGINPGTSADLTVATLFAAACLDPSLMQLPFPRVHT